MTEYPNWFAQTAEYNFDNFLKPIAKQPNLKFLQLGAFTGDASKWMLDNILSDDSILIDVDTWGGSDEEAHHSMDFKDVEKTYDTKLKDYNNLIKFKGTTVDFFFSEHAKPETFDFIYVDADHTAKSVLEDAVHSFAMLKSGGIIGFDDYTWGSNLPILDTPKPAIQMFANIYAKQLDVIAINSQLWIKKK